MFELEPIPEKIQKRMFQKMALLARDTKKVKDLDIKKLSSKSTFARMTSGQTHPVVLMSGTLNSDGNIAGGYNDIYGPRTYKGLSQEEALDLYNSGDTVNYNELELESIIERGGDGVGIKNNLKRPMPGIKSIDVTFKGGTRALREATISWMCWDWEELNFLMPHFLAHGKTVMLEWGWVFDKNTLTKLNKFLKVEDNGRRYIAADAYTDYRDEVIENSGDFDIMSGIIKNFEFTTRTDGGFDCKTILTSVGVSLMQAPQPETTVLDPGTRYNLSANESAVATAQKLKAATGEKSSKNFITDFFDGPGDKLKIATRGNVDLLIDLNTNTTLKQFISKIDVFIAQDVIRNNALPATNRDRIAVVANISVYTDYRKNKQREVWVRWGWFEDNILSPFISLTASPQQVAGDNTSYNKIINEFRSIDIIDNPDGTEKDKETRTKKYQSVRIKNHSELKTVNIRHYILPGQFDYRKRLEDEGEIDSTGKQTRPVILPGDVDYIIKLADKVNKNFSKFDTGDKNNPKGYLRNMLINTRTIKQAFGANSGEQVVTDGFNITQSIKNLFKALNQELSFWNFELTTDSIEDYRVKIVDKQITAHDFTQKTSQQKSSYDLDKDELNTTDKEGNTKSGPGVFFFPVWRKDSFVKQQDVTAKIPTSMAIATMYGANMDQLRDLSNPGSSYIAKEGVAVGGFWDKLADTRLNQLDIAFRNNDNIGAPHGIDPKNPTGSFIDDANMPLRIRGKNSDNKIREFVKNNSNELELSYEKRLADINKKLNQEQAFVSKYDASIPPPYIDNEDINVVINYIRQNVDQFETRDIGPGGLKSLIDTYGTIWETGDNRKKATPYRMKQAFIDSILYLTSQYGKFKQADVPLLIPFDIELSIEGIGGIYPGNSFHSDYLPQKYKDETVFQVFDVNHTLDSSGWTTTLSGKMRTTMAAVFRDSMTLFEKIEQQLINLERQSETLSEENKKTSEAFKKYKQDVKDAIASPITQKESRTFRGRQRGLLDNTTIMLKRLPETSKAVYRYLKQFIVNETNE